MKLKEVILYVFKKNHLLSYIYCSSPTGLLSRQIDYYRVSVLVDCCRVYVSFVYYPVVD